MGYFKLNPAIYKRFTKLQKFITHPYEIISQLLPKKQSMKKNTAEQAAELKNSRALTSYAQIDKLISSSNKSLKS